MAKSFKEIREEFKDDMKKTNAKFAADKKNIVPKIDKKVIVQEPKTDKPKIGAFRFLAALWFTIATFPLFVIGLVLLLMFFLLMWDIFFGL